MKNQNNPASLPVPPAKAMAILIQEHIPGGSLSSLGYMTPQCLIETDDQKTASIIVSGPEGVFLVSVESLKDHPYGADFPVVAVSETARSISAEVRLKRRERVRGKRPLDLTGELFHLKRIFWNYWRSRIGTNGHTHISCAYAWHYCALWLSNEVEQSTQYKHRASSAKLRRKGKI